MSLELLERFEERERLPKKRYAIFTQEDGLKWWLTLTLHFNDAAAQSNIPCLENDIYALKGPLRRKNALGMLFTTFVDFAVLQFFDNTITRVRLQTKVPTTQRKTNPGESVVPAAVRSALVGANGVLECLIAEDETSAIPFISPTCYEILYPNIRFVQYRHIARLQKSKRTSHDNVSEVLDLSLNKCFVFKEANNPEDIKAQQNEIDALVRLATSRHVVGLHGLVVSDNPYHSRPATPLEPVVRGFLLEHASRGNLRDLLSANSLRISWSQRLAWATQITRGLQDIHGANIAHMDLKASNIVIDEFNSAIIIDLSRTARTYGWKAPETYTDRLEPEFEGKADIYSLGVVFWEIMTGKDVGIPIGMKHADYFAVEGYTAPEAYGALIKACLQHDPNNRPTLPEIDCVLQRIEQNCSEIDMRQAE